jgi:16S rRNA (uracil1498-N3)-methyltransferase
MLKRFFSTQIIDNQCILDEQESHHCKNVLRGKINEQVEVIDGSGNLYTGRIHVLHNKRCIIEDLYLVKYEENMHKLTLGLCPPKHPARLEWIIEKATELGVKDIILIQSERTEQFYPKLSRYRQLIIAATKQSQQLWIPLISTATLAEFIENSNHIVKCIAHCIPEKKTKFSSIVNSKSSTVILIGPEGDFSPMEASHAISNGYIPVSLGNQRLRTETAALQACACYNAMI